VAAKTARGPAEATSEPEAAAEAIPPVAAAPQQRDCRLPAASLEEEGAALPSPARSASSALALPFAPAPAPPARLLSTTSESTTTSAHAVDAAATSVAASSVALDDTSSGLAIAAHAAAPDTPHSAR